MIALCLCLLLLALPLAAAPTNSTCTYPASIPCPAPAYCPNSSEIVLPLVASYTCTQPLNVTGTGTVLVKGGIYKGGLTITAPNVIVGNADVVGNLTIRYTGNVTIKSAVEISMFLIVVPADNAGQTYVGLVGLNMNCQKMVVAGTVVAITNQTLVATYPPTCLYKVLQVNQFMGPAKSALANVSATLQEMLSLPINIIVFAESDFEMTDSNIVTTMFTLYANNTLFKNSVVNTSAQACLTNLGLGKGLQAQMQNKVYCSSGGSSAGYGTLSKANCSAALQYFMFLSHSFPYLSKGPYLSTGSGGYGYRDDLTNQGAGGGVIFVFIKSEFTSYNSSLSADGGLVRGNYYLSAGSGGTVFIYTQKLAGNTTNFTAMGGASYNNNGSGAGGIVKISYNSLIYTVDETMMVNVNSGYQPSPPEMSVQSSGIFYGVFCRPGEYVNFLGCSPCAYGSYSLLGDSSCQTCPTAQNYLPNSDTQLNSVSNITQCFSEKRANYFETWIQPGLITWFTIILYVVTLFVVMIVGLLIKKKYRKKLSVMETESFSLEDAKKDVQQTRILTESLKAERNIKFEDLMYHIHRITLFGSNNPQCPWALPQYPPEQIKQYILRQGFVDFSVKFNKVAKWTSLEKFISRLTYLLYPVHWYYYDKIKKLKYKKLLALLQQSKQFNLINNYDFEDKDMVTIKISKNADYTICYLDFMVYDRADTKYFNLSSPFIISISGEGNFIRPFYLEDRDVFFNSLFYIINKAQQKNEKSEDQKKQLFTNLLIQKKKQQNRNKLIDFLKKFNRISITLDLCAPLTTFVNILTELINFIAEWNENYFKQLGIQLDLIFMISKIKNNQVVANQIHILTNKYPETFREFMERNIPKMNRHDKYDLKLGLFVYNPDQEIMKAQNRKDTATHRFKKSWAGTEIGALPPDEEELENNFIDADETEDLIKEKPKTKILKCCVRALNFVRFLLMTHRKLQFDKDVIKFAVTVVILFQCLLVFLWSVRLQVPYIFANVLSPFVGILWTVSGSYGIGKLFLIFNAMALLDEIVTMFLYLILQIINGESEREIIKLLVCQIINITLKVLAILLATKFLSVSRKLSTSKMFK